MDYKKLYENNERFKKFVEQVCAKYNISVEEALQYCAIKDVGDYYANSEEKNDPNFEFIKH